ncbi:MAG: hypothetical protein HZB70_03425 [Candidatus Berkelbacteria bacterium]|nr:MAG: hypothetical protein HZB70_03425 [Candidatus Berkelbacteria bacterium]QQG51647.1 MAG: hypothetical protein HY845_03765 [Candidatus Berkelbacteria bacterium]
MLISSLSFIVLGPKGPELTSKKPPGVHIRRDLDGWWFDADKPAGKQLPPYELIRQIGEDFTARAHGDYGLMGVIESGNKVHAKNARRFCAEYRKAHPAGRRTSRAECVATQCALAAL